MMMPGARQLGNHQPEKEGEGKQDLQNEKKN